MNDAGHVAAEFLELPIFAEDIAKFVKKGPENLCSLDFHLKEVKSRFKRLGL